MDNVTHAGVSLAIVWGAMAERAKLWAYFAFGVCFTLIHSGTSHWVWHAAGARPRRRRRVYLLRVVRVPLDDEAVVGIRVEEHVETAGLDVSEHGMWGYPEFCIPVPGGYGTESHTHLLGQVHRHPAVEAEAA